MNAPRACPKSSDSTSPGGMAPQFTGTKGMAARGESSWSARATSSLPVPLSPEMSTVVETGASFRICLWSCCTASELPTIRSSGPRSAPERRSRRFSVTSRRRSSAFFRTRTTSSGLKGLET